MALSFFFVDNWKSFGFILDWDDKSLTIAFIISCFAYLFSGFII